MHIPDGYLSSAGDGGRRTVTADHLHLTTADARRAGARLRSAPPKH